MVDHHNFDRFLQEVIPSEIPVEYIDHVVVTYKNGKVTKLTHAELTNPLPVEGGVLWPQVEKNFKNVNSIEVHVNTRKLQQRVIERSNDMFGKAFEDTLDENTFEEKKDKEE